MSSETILRMGTIAGAEALGIASEVGTLTPGKFADFVAIPCPVGSNSWEAILHDDAQPSHVFVRGQEITH
jgi:imidazolonepropionase-like amidohydrolase